MKRSLSDPKEHAIFLLASCANKQQAIDHAEWAYQFVKKTATVAFWQQVLEELKQHTIMEAIVTQINVYDKHCIGSQKYKRDIMISFKTEESEEFNDIFLDESQARFLLAKLTQRLAENKEERSLL